MIRERMCPMTVMLLAFSLPIGLVAQDAAETGMDADRGMVTRGRRMYQRKCVFCHGTRGEGDGPVSRYVFPRPRDLRAGIFKIRSTPSGALPTDQDLFDTLTRGLPGTTMPAWLNLSEPQRWELVAYVKVLSGRFEAEPPVEPIEIGEPNPPYAESIANGRRLFIDAECWACHGSLGRGDGPSSQGLTDDWGYRIVPADLTLAANWRGGHSARDVFRSISVGIGGTPMPSFGDALTDDQLWDLVNFLRSNIGR